MTSKKRYFQSVVVSLSLIVLLIGVLSWVAHRRLQQEKLDRALLLAIRQDDVTTVGALLDQGADANAREVAKETLSFWRILLDTVRGAHAASRTKPTALLISLGLDETNSSIIEDSDNRIVQDLLRHGADVNMKAQDGQTPLMLASNRGDPEVVLSLLQRGADINAQDNAGYDAIMQATMGGSVDSVRKLIVRGADLHHRTVDGETVMSLAREGLTINRDAIIRLLKQAGASK